MQCHIQFHFPKRFGILVQIRFIKSTVLIQLNCFCAKFHFGKQWRISQNASKLKIVSSKMKFHIHIYHNLNSVELIRIQYRLSSESLFSQIFFVIMFLFKTCEPANHSRFGSRSMAMTNADWPSKNRLFDFARENLLMYD